MMAQAIHHKGPHDLALATHRCFGDEEKRLEYPAAGELQMARVNELEANQKGVTVTFKTLQGLLVGSLGTPPAC
jgi:hypothetical protein